MHKVNKLGDYNYVCFSAMHNMPGNKVVEAEARISEAYSRLKERDNGKMKGRNKKATTYSPTFYGSTIGAAGLNFSVRNGKRCTPAL